MKVLDISTRLAGNIKTTDSQSGYRAYSRKAIEKIEITNPDKGAGSEILTQLKKFNLNVVEIPITVRYDIENTSTKNPVTHGFGVLGCLISVTSESGPLFFFGVVCRDGVHDHRVDIGCKRAVVCCKYGKRSCSWVWAYVNIFIRGYCK